MIAFSDIFHAAASPHLQNQCGYNDSSTFNISIIINHHFITLVWLVRFEFFATAMAAVQTTIYYTSAI